jgi:hypothetical protein
MQFMPSQNNHGATFQGEGAINRVKSPPFESSAALRNARNIFIWILQQTLCLRAPGKFIWISKRIKVLVSLDMSDSSNIAREPFGEILLLLNLDRSAVKDVSNSYIAPGHKSDKLELKQPARQTTSLSFPAAQSRLSLGSARCISPADWKCNLST